MMYCHPLQQKKIIVAYHFEVFYTGMVEVDKTILCSLYTVSPTVSQAVFCDMLVMVYT